MEFKTLSESGTPTQSTPLAYTSIILCPFVVTCTPTNHSCDGNYTCFGRNQCSCLVPASSRSSLNLHQSQSQEACMIESKVTTAPESEDKQRKQLKNSAVFQAALFSGLSPCLHHFNCVWC